MVSRIEQLAASCGDLQVILDELRSGGLVVRSGRDPLVSAQVPDAVLEEFVDLAALEASDGAALSLAHALADTVAKRGVGEQALRHLNGHLGPAERSVVEARLQLLRTSTGDVVTRHRAWVAEILNRTDPDTGPYYMFLRDNIGELVAAAPEDLGLFLLAPTTRAGRGDFTWHSLGLAVTHAPRPEPFQQRMIEWIRDGSCDRPDGLAPFLLWHSLTRHAADRRWNIVREAAHDRVLTLLRSPDLTTQAQALLVGTLAGGYAFTDELLYQISLAQIPTTAARRRRLGPVLAAMDQMVGTGHDRRMSGIGLANRVRALDEQTAQAAGAAEAMLGATAPGRDADDEPDGFLLTPPSPPPPPPAPPPWWRRLLGG